MLKHSRFPQDKAAIYKGREARCAGTRVRAVVITPDQEALRVRRSKGRLGASGTGDE
jgi:hypothetical protein